MTTNEITTFGPGNTNTGPKLKKRRDWILTLNLKTLEHYEEIFQYFQNLKSLNYYLCVEHIGQENKHYHIFVQFRTPIKLSLKKLYGSHVEAIKGTPQEAVKYLKCEDKKHKKLNITYKLIDENGDLRKYGGLNAKAILEMTDEEFFENTPLPFLRVGEYIREKNRAREEFFTMLDEIKNEELKAPEIIYIHGDPGQGKTYGGYKYALQAEDYEVKKVGKITINNNFCSFTNETAESFVIEEFRPSQISAADFLQLTDKYGYNSNIKGGHYYVRPKRLIICSVKSPYEIYKDENNKQFRRRITKYFEAVKEGNTYKLLESELEKD